MTINAISIIPCKTAGCPTMGDYAIKKKMNVKWGNHRKGDIVLFDFNHNGTSDHIGIVESVNKNGTITTIEGNTGSGSNTNGGQVQRRTRYKSNVNYFVRPKYNSKVTPDMIIATARAELGVRESPRNSNKVKYNQWFYGKNTSAYWCCTFVCWLFAHVKEAVVIPTVKKPTGKYSGVIPTGLLRKGSKGDAVKNWQKFLVWYCKITDKKFVDGKFGSNTEWYTMIFQKTEGLSYDGEAGKLTFAKANTYKAATPKPAPKPTPAPAPKPAPKPAAKLKSYRIEVDLTNQITTIYGIYSDGSKKGIMSEFVSTARKGKTTPVGTFKIQGASGGRKAKLRTAKMSSGKSYAEFLCRFHGAKCMHTVPYKTRNTKGYVTKSEFNKLGTPRSAGCVRMPYKMAKYIYEKCPVGTPVIVFKGKAGNYPMGKPKKYTATSNVDPTK